MSQRTDTVRADVTSLTARAAACLQQAGSEADEARLVAESLIEADRRGIYSHGLIRLPIYAEAAVAGGIVVNAPMEWTRETGATAVLDAQCGFGQTAMARALEKARELVDRFGTACVAVNNSSHYGAGAIWTDQLAAAGLVSLLCSTTGPLVAPYGARERVFGSNPLSVSVPTPGAPVTVDMATSAAAFGKIKEAYAAGQSIPEDWALDSAGHATTDAAAAMTGALMPFGGHKGSGIAVVVELLAGAVAGGRFASETTDLWTDRSANTRTGHLLWVLDPVKLLGDDSGIARAGELQDRIRSSAPAAGFERVQAPGDPERAHLRAGTVEVDIPSHILAGLDKLEADLGVSP
ncbi:Ldh family oxidoreductase [Brevibacterium daeguense]|uniref:Ldh family oxidoreductase n=1 Tax=Brevibacterium daeguense TaxID=909936 RepID=A0ABP8EFL1_9MICO|nr:Ldh family oxidoreductase [Brevibacterium daeguense]